MCIISGIFMLISMLIIVISVYSISWNGVDFSVNSVNSVVVDMLLNSLISNFRLIKWVSSVLLVM